MQGEEKKKKPSISIEPFTELPYSWYFLQKLAEVCTPLGWLSPGLLEVTAMPVAGYTLLLKHLLKGQPFLLTYNILKVLRKLKFILQFCRLLPHLNPNPL